MTKEMTEKTGVSEAINQVVKELPAIGKNSRNQKQGFMFRSVDDIKTALKPLLGKHGLFYYPHAVPYREIEKRPTERGGAMFSCQLVVEYRIQHKDGSYIDVSVPAESTDSFDKATTKAMTFAEKTLLNQVFCIPTHDVDPDEVTPEEASGKPSWAVQIDSMETAEAVEALIHGWAQKYAVPENVQGYANRRIIELRKK